VRDLVPGPELVPTRRVTGPDDHSGPRGAIFVVSETAAGRRGPVASLVSVAGWAGAARRVLGNSWIATPDGVLDPGDARRQGSSPALRSDTMPRWRRFVPTTATTAIKDVQSWWGARHYRIDPEGPWRRSELAFVWQRLEMFQVAGLRLARSLGVPSVLFVPATQVWQAEQWGVGRPGWGRRLERIGESPALRSADVVACGTDAVAEQAERLGAPARRIVITPTGVDLDLFPARAPASGRRRALGLEDRFVVGWLGSFRRFHSLEQAVVAVARVAGASLLMVGDGPERPRIEQLARDNGVHAVFTGTVAQVDLADHLAVMDAALVLAPVDAEFHYSPLKLAEYLAAGIPVVAPSVGQLRERLTDHLDALLVPPNDPERLVAAITELRDDPELARRIGRAGRAAAEARWSWDHQMRRVLDALAT
jgi:glycosyltransferase involved in cell wall biosynthesis